MKNEKVNRRGSGLEENIPDSVSTSAGRKMPFSKNCSTHPDVELALL